MKTVGTFVMPMLLILATAGCVQIEEGRIEGPLPRIATSSVAVFEAESQVTGGYTLIEDIFIDYEDFSRKEMLERLRSLAGQKGANAIILNRDFPRPDGIRDVSGLYLTDPEPTTGARAIYIGTVPQRPQYGKLP